MSKLEDFKVGDYVAHIMIGDGRVTAVDEQGVHVTYAHQRNKKPVHGIYDKQWFALNGDGYLFHRSRQEKRMLKLERDEQASTKGNPKTGKQA